MQILADENFPGQAVEALRGHDVAWVREDSPGSPDLEVLERAAAESRLLITFDKDFAVLAFRSGVRLSAGVVLFRTIAGTPERLAQRLVSLLEGRRDWEGHFSVIEEGRIRMRPLPAGRGQFPEGA